ncbi:MAG: hypothetical protein U0930_22690 [Pirellulales bacterium]
MSSVDNGQMQGTGMRTQRVDTVASLLMSMLIIIGGLVSVLVVFWASQTFTWPRVDGIKVEEEHYAGRGDHAAGFERDIDPPGAEDSEVLAEPTLEKSLEAVTDAASTVAASIDTVNSDSDSSVQGKNGKGDSRPPGPLGEGDDIIPRFERWELKFQSKGLKPYAEQIDFYKIELGCFGGSASVDYASSVSKNPKKRSGTSEEENKSQRIFFMWRTENPLKQYDVQLLTQAGVKTQGRMIVRFIPKELEEKLAVAEKIYYTSKGKKTAKEVAKTVFESRPTSSGFEFVVIEQFYRTPTR